MQSSPYQRGLLMVVLGVIFLSFDGLLIRLARADWGFYAGQASGWQH